MAKYLLIAHQTAERQELFDAAKELAAQDSHARFTLLVPATPVGDLMTWEEGETKEVARAQARSAAEALKRQGSISAA
jgi:triosephosphate isomerase